jgi:excisionase family DNA binding protein
MNDISIQQAAEQKNVHANTIRGLIASGELKAFRLGAKLIRIKQADLDAIYRPVRSATYDGDINRYSPEKKNAPRRAGTQIAELNRNP